MCGIFGMINKNKQGRFNYPAFTTLGIANDSRGGDSCGIFIDGKTEYGIDKTKLFSEFINTSELLKSTTKCHIALGHCRKASIGAIDLQRAQPVVLKNNKEEIEFVVMHNGTIHNYKELAQKYIPEINITNMSDSQVMARIFYHCGFDVLSEYYGGAVFVIVDYRKGEPQIYVFKGYSRYYETSKTETEERPFYFTTTNSSFYFSSIYNWLKPFTKNEIYTIPENTVVSIQDNEIYIEKEIDRSKCTQCAKTQYNNTHQYYGYGYYNSDGYQEYKGSYTYLNTQANTHINKKITVTVAGLYKFDSGEFVHGTIYVRPDGTVGYSHDALYLSFWHGILLKNRPCFTFLENFCTKCNLQTENLAYIIPDTLELLNFHPTCVYENGEYLLYWRNDLDSTTPYDGKIQYIGEDCIYIVEEGMMVDCIPANNNDIIKQHYTDNLMFKLDTNVLNQLIITECNSKQNE